MQNDLMDRYSLMINPIVLGGGKRLFRDGSAMRKVRLADPETSGTGILITTYEPARS